MEEKKFTLSKPEDVKAFNEITGKTIDVYDNMLRYFPIDERPAAFVKDVITDYIWDIVNAVCEAPDYQLGWYWNGDVHEYADQLNDAIKNRRNTILNAFITYVENKDHLQELEPDEMNDVSADYYGLFGGSLDDTPSASRIINLSSDDIKELNKLLRLANLPEFEDKRELVK